MIRRLNRFHGHGSIRVVYRDGSTARSRSLGLKYVSYPHKKPYRAAVVVSRKVNKSAVVRNRLRRRIYETLRRQSDIPPGLDLVFTVFDDGLMTYDSQRLEEVIISLLEQAKQSVPTNPRTLNRGRDIVKPEGNKR